MGKWRRENESVRKRVAVSVVRDSESNDLIVKMVNLLPVVVNSQVKLEGIDAINPSAIRTVLTGTPDSKNDRPVTDKILITKDFRCSLPAYSFTVIRIKSEIFRHKRIQDY
jgi:hypothetical protein